MYHVSPETHDGPLGAGDYTYTWFMRDTRGHPVGSGIYLARLELGSSGKGAQTVRVLVTR